MERRTFLQTSSLACLSGISGTPVKNLTHKDGKIRPAICLNAFSFNQMLLAGDLSLEKLFRFAAETGFQGIDLTAYYIPGYPEVPEDEVLFDIKKMAFRLGLTITGTGVRNDFTLADTGMRKKEIQLVKNWVVAAAKMGAPHLRVFAGRNTEGNSRDEAISWIIEGFGECADFASEYGVMIAFQNHNDIIVTPSDIFTIMDAMDSEWFGLMLDTGSLPVDDPYQAIQSLIPYAISWQVKENIKTTDSIIPTDFKTLMKIVDDARYQGYFPLETLGEGDPFEKVKALYKQAENYMF